MIRPICRRFALCAGGILLALTAFSWRATGQALIPPAQAPTTVTTSHTVKPQVRTEYRFPEETITFSTDFDGARLSSVERTGPGRFKAVVAPENEPINNSAWYAFQVRSKKRQTLYLELEYRGGPHRYTPKISHDRENWQVLSESEAISDKLCGFRLDVGPKPVYVAAQELLSTRDMYAWARKLASTSPGVTWRLLGRSTAGKPIRALTIGNPKSAYNIIIVGRQHPPEVTGSLALKSFVETLCSPSESAVAFRKFCKVTVVPVLNPDGVDAGHWRHNAQGTDLNRDWGQFNQAETRLVRDEVSRLASEGQLVFALDFHSTRKDVFYISHPRTQDPRQTIVWEWLQQLRTRLKPGEAPTAEHNLDNPSAATAVFASWLSHSFQIPGITYEVGDATDRTRIATVAATSARSMMHVLLQNESVLNQLPPVSNGKTSVRAPSLADPSFSPHQPGRKIKVALYKGAGTGGQGPPSIISYCDSGTNVVVAELSPSDIRKGLLQKFDTVIFAGGSASKQAETIGESGRQEVRRFVESGGGYIGICAGAYLASSGFSWGLDLVDSITVSPKWQRGEGKVKIELTSEGRDCLANKPGELLVKYQNGPVLKPFESPDLPDYEVLAWFRTEVAENNTPKGIMIGAPAILRAPYGNGRVVCFSPHPEQTPGLEALVEAAILWSAGVTSTGSLAGQQ